jgi:hypothetical protein
VHRVISLLSLLLLALLAPARGAERVEQWTGPGAAEFRLAVSKGQVTVENAEDGVLRVEVRAVSASLNPDRAAAELKEIRLVWAAVGDWCTLDVSRPGDAGVRFVWQEKDPVSVEVRVALPAMRKLQVVSNDGAVTIGRITADVEVQARRGQVNCTLVQGNLLVRAAEGSILASRVTGDADLRSEFGNVSAGTVGGRANVFTRNGNVELLAAKGGIDAESDGGNVTASLTPSLQGPARIKSAGGNVILKIDPGARLDLEATSTWGKIRDCSTARQPLPAALTAAGLGGRRLVARLNAGGPAVQAHASGGDVELIADESLF